MLNRSTDINIRLNGLKKIFDRIENYDINQNVGLRSLKNIGVWLSLYVLIDDDHKIRVIDELAQLANADMTDKENIKKLIDELIVPKTLAQIMSDYVEADGSYRLKANQKTLDDLSMLLIEKKYAEIFEGHLEVDSNLPNHLFSLSMNNEIKFNWAAESEFGYDVLESGEYKQSKREFGGKQIDFLTASTGRGHVVKYGIIERDHRLFHLVCFTTLQIKGEQATPTYTYLIESVDPKDTIYLQKEYFEIINQLKNKEFDHANTCYIVQNNELAQKNVQLHHFQKDQYCEFKVRFPKILEPMITTEKRLGIYEPFCGKTINQNVIILKYLGNRQLNYDEKGGEIKNLEDIGLTGACYRGRYTTIEYTVSNSFMMIYEAQNGADYYPYFIANPTKDLKMSFTDVDCQKAPISSTSNIQNFLKQNIIQNPVIMDVSPIDKSSTRSYGFEPSENYPNTDKYAPQEGRDNLLKRKI